jgi:hypothetical protein
MAWNTTANFWLILSLLVYGFGTEDLVGVGVNYSGVRDGGGIA